MSKFYGVVMGDMSQTNATRRGSNHIKTSAQSFNGSVQTELSYDSDGRLIVTVSVCEGTGYSGIIIFCGTFDEFKRKLIAE